jgi:hypothetical protein
MDPVSALGVAGVVVQFVDFAGNLVSATRKISASETGELRENEENESIAKKLTALNDRLLAAGEATVPPSMSQNEAEIRKLCSECSKVAKELLDALEKSRPQTKTGSFLSFRIALMSVWNQKQMETFKNRIENYRQQLVMHILASLR